MEITQTEGQRFEVALQVFKSRTEPLKYKSIILYFLDDNTVNCNYPSSYLPPNVTEQRAWADINTAKSIFKELLDRSSDFAAIVRNKTVRYNLYHGLERGDTTWICSTVGEDIVWENDSPKSPGRLTSGSS